MYRMCSIIYNGGQSTKQLSTRGVWQDYGKKTRKTALFKLKVIDTAEKCGNRAAGREYSVNEKLVRDWRKKKAELEALPRGKRSLTILLVDTHTHNWWD